MSVPKKTEMCVCVYVCGKGASLWGFAKLLGTSLSLQSSYREGPMLHTYTHFSLFSYRYRSASLEGFRKAPLYKGLCYGEFAKPLQNSYREGLCEAPLYKRILYVLGIDIPPEALS